ncbi:MAG TPA: hypothetical protein V6D33_15230 [Cyanophyceae cyanobacterium]
MPRRRQRFSQLERQFRESGGVAAPGSRLAGYIDFKNGTTKIDVKVKLTAAQRKRFGFGILPFNVAPSDPVVPADRYAAPITAYSNAGRTDLGLINTQLGYANIDAETRQAENFYPAVLRVFVPTSGATPTTPTSAITKKEYTRIPGKSYSIPFGRTTAGAKTDTEEGRRAALASDAKKGSGTNQASSVSYDPEVFKVGKPDLTSPTP